MGRKKGSKNKVVKKSVKQDTPEAPFILNLSLGDSEYNSSGATLLDALIALPPPPKIVGKGIMTITHGEMKAQQLFTPIRLKRLFHRSRSLLEVQAKQLSVNMKVL